MELLPLSYALSIVHCPNECMDVAAGFGRGGSTSRATHQLVNLNWKPEESQHSAERERRGGAQLYHVQNTHRTGRPNQMTNRDVQIFLAIRPIGLTRNLELLLLLLLLFFLSGRRCIQKCKPPCQVSIKFQPLPPHCVFFFTPATGCVLKMAVKGDQTLKQVPIPRRNPFRPKKSLYYAIFCSD